MAQIVKLRRSATTGNKPTTEQLELGELAMNTYDGKIYFEKSGSAGESIEEILTTNAQNTGSLSISGSSHNITGALELSGSLKLPNTVRDYTNSTGSVGQVLQITENGAIWIDNIAANVGDGRTAKQTFEASTTWVFTHNLNEKYPVVELYDIDDQILVAPTIATNANTLTITFAIPVAGTAVATVGGMRGYQGFQGFQGQDGYVGADGVQGNQGDRGFQGFQGVKGDQGVTGAQGFQGPIGFQGSQGEIGAQGAISASARNVTVFTTTLNQTTFTVPGGYNIGLVDVFWNGVKQTVGVDYTASNGTTVVLANGAAAGDTIEINNYLGEIGSQGNQGATGAQGSVGAQGATGNQGAVGAQGPTGSQGSVGAQGSVGPQGETGFQGNQGPTGLQGAKGDQGFQGIQGFQGDQGIQGTKGDQGDQGFQGAKGDQGNQGPIGPQGIKGDKGDQGDRGFQGFQGIQGTVGTQGTTGVQGAKGDQGYQGITGQGFIIYQTYNSVAALLADNTCPDGQFGLVGGSLSQSDPDYGKLYLRSGGVWSFTTDMSVQGIQGSTGAQGSTGQQGFKGDQGNQGDQGARGFQGDQGRQGAQGDQGTQGFQGAKGDKGDKGDQGDRGLKGDQGDRGFQGFKGDQGDRGFQGFKGDKGDKGDQGDRGFQGFKGDKGDKGDQGDRGFQGFKGDKGDKGDQGDRGFQGFKGDKGDQGTAGSLDAVARAGDTMTGQLIIGAGGIGMQRTQTNNAIWFNSGADQNHVLWNSYYGGPTTRTGSPSDFDGIYWNTYRGIQIRGGLSGAFNCIIVTNSSDNLNDHTVSLYASNVLRLQTTTSGVNIFGNLISTGTVFATNGGVDGTFADAFVARFSSNNAEQNAIQTAVSSAAGGSGFRFQVSNGGGSSGRTTTADFLRNNTLVYTNFTASTDGIFGNNRTGNDAGATVLNILGSSSSSTSSQLNLTQVWNGVQYPVILRNIYNPTDGSASSLFTLSTTRWNGSAAITTERFRVDGNNGMATFYGGITVSTGTSPGLNIIKDASVDNRYLRLSNTQTSSKSWDLINQTNANGNKFVIYNATDNLVAVEVLINGGVNFSNTLYLPGSIAGRTAQIEFNNSGSANLLGMPNLTTSFYLTYGTGNIHFRNDNAGEILRLINNANVYVVNNLGIGTSSPGQALTLGANKNIRLDWGGGTDTTFEMFYDSDFRQGITFQGNARKTTIHNYSGDTTDTTITLHNGNVGINTISPSPHQGKGLVIRGVSSGRAIMELWDDTSGKSVFQNVSGDTYIGQLDKGTGQGRTYLLVNGNGSSADVAVTLNANGQAVFANNISAGTTINWNSGIGALSYGTGFITMETNSANAIQFKTNGSTAQTINTNQTVLFASNIGVNNTFGLLFNGLSDSNWKIYRTNGTPDFARAIITGPSLNINAHYSSEGFAIGANGGNSYYEILGNSNGTSATHYFRGTAQVTGALSSASLNTGAINGGRTSVGVLNFSCGFGSYTTDGLFNAQSVYSYVTTPSGTDRIRFGYNDYGGGQYYGAIGFQGPTNFSIGHGYNSNGNFFRIGTGFRDDGIVISANNNIFIPAKLSIGTFDANDAGLNIRGYGVADGSTNYGVILARGTKIAWTDTGNASTGEYIFSQQGSPYGVTIHSGAQAAITCPNTGHVLINHLAGTCSIGSTSFSTSYKLYVTGQIYATSDITAYSDKRKKENIITINQALDKVLGLRGVFYNRIDDDSKQRNLGVIAQEVLEILPEAVSYANDTDEYGVKYGNMAGLFIEAIKEQQTQIESQKSEIEELKDLVKQLINR
jgi:hypothetical protein